MSVTSGGGVVPSRLLTAPSSVPRFTPTYASFIVLEMHYMPAVSKDQLHFENMQVSHILK